MSLEIRFLVPAVPVPLPRQRHRIVTTGTGKQFVANYTPRDSAVVAFKATARLACEQAYRGEPLEGPLRLDAVFVMPRPGYLCWKRKPMPRVPHGIMPDTSNLLKALEDALNGTLWKDDAQVAEVHAYKVVAAGDEQPHVEVAVTLLERPAEGAAREESTPTLFPEEG